ncbi:alanyl-tRNA editing protein AlaXM [Candidatus Korarchaeum cryptofilum]|jgi:misacylated tRNA(Ala) deacylase|uniref:Threonyl/alanyl tRNA synthetase SAD n=1 Tax=Korarchaeum cryptofilum (strain OPF8) TaxID=374847 RepID=B1L4W6_KORCO|nr:alanyl-tRNA editing protein AlaXM [Candidatus Korarchaeum cryptofilum]ACB07495.1 Threonyl/alanyl tRNA synthetase SAD [Candidatus Korarchaeum cryptofilum OPF8]
MAELIYQADCYVTDFEARVTRVEGNKLFLDRTAFHPTSGGVANDTGFIESSSGRWNVIDVIEEGDVAHLLDSKPDLSVGDIVRGHIDWDRRYRLMRLHTADHILTAILYKEKGALVTGGHIDPEYAKSDFSLERGEREVFEEAIKKVNEIASSGIEVKIYFLPREEAMKIPGIVKLAAKMPPTLEKLRIVEIPGIDIQADGGPHVRNTREIGEVKLLKVENKGKGKKRVYFTVP